jgi:outer membrane lipoprotein-sorting protein
MTKTKRMRLFSKVFFFLLICLFVPAGSAFGADELNATLAKLDAAAARFKSTTAEFEFDSIQTDPIPDKDVQKGTVYYDRRGNAFQMGIHITEINGRPVPKVIVVSGGVFKMYDKLQNQVTTSNKVSKYESYLILGFGASGKDLEAKWNLKDLGAETMNGVKTEKLELVAKDPDVLKLFPKVTIWVDAERGVSLKQEFDEGQGQSRVCFYGKIKVNEALPGDAFTFKTDPNPQYITR